MFFAEGLARKRTCTGFADKHCNPTRESFIVHSIATKFVLSGKRNFPYLEFFLLRCRGYRMRQCRRCGVLINLLRIPLIFLLPYLCGSRYGHGVRWGTGRRG